MFVCHDCSQSKVSNLDVHLSIEEYIAHLQIAMDDRPLVHILDSSTDLNHVSTDLR